MFKPFSFSQQFRIISNFPNKLSINIFGWEELINSLQADENSFLSSVDDIKLPTKLTSLKDVSVSTLTRVVQEIMMKYK